MQAGREIKFRGKCIADGELNGEWVFGDLLQKNGKIYIAPHSNSVSVNGHIGKLIIMHEVSPESVGQFTGLRDKNGKEIYEGDFVRVRPRLVENQDAFTAPIVWKRSGFELDRTIDGWIGYPIVTRLDGMADELEVIGNIYEHPELLQAG